MADEEQANVISAAFPAPPPFYKHFTSENLQRLKELREAAASDEADKQKQKRSNIPSPPQTLELPPELRYLIPPEPPSNGKYRGFGFSYDIHETLPSLKEQGVEQLYPSPPPTPSDGTEGTQSEWTLDRALHLKKMAKSILLNFLELVGVLSIDPAQYAQKIEDLRILFINSHHLINEYRPHQARETLIMMMEDQLDQKRAEVDGIRKMKEKIEGLLGGLDKMPPQQHPSIGEEEDQEPMPKAAWMEEQQLLWQALDSELDA